VLAASEEPADQLVERAVAAAARGESAQAIALATEAIRQDERNAGAYKLRGREYFRAGRMAESIADLDQFAVLRPELEPQQWERGIAYYYAGQYKRGAEQFERYQSFDGHDVENSVWRYLCLVPDVGIERARETMLPIEGDRRVPMMQIWQLYRGNCQPDEVLAAANAGDPNEEVRAGRLFYAHLYLGLWHDSLGNQAEARRFIELASAESLAKNPQINRYMWDVARIHARRLRGELKR
jgi:lipoprotein NlpI